MRKILLLGSLTALAIAAIAATASARTETRFTLVRTHISQHPSGHNFISKARLVRPRDRDDVVGRDRVKLTDRGHQRVRIRGVAFFPNGTIKVKGVAGPGSNRIPIIGGTGAFNGAAGKLLIRGRKQDHITFIFVQ